MRTWTARGSVLAAAVLSLLLARCSSDPPSHQQTPDSNTPCTGNPGACPAGETCWYSDGLATTFVCKHSTADAGANSACEALVGVPTCSTGLVCLRKPNASQPTCVAYCDADAGTGCAAGETCQALPLASGATLPLCTGGGGGGGTATDAGAD